MRSSIRHGVRNIGRARRVGHFGRALRGGAAGLLLIGLAACAGTPSPSADGTAVDTGLAQAALHAGAPADALQLADRVLAQHPDNTAARLVRAEALSGLGQADPARADFARVLQSTPSPARHCWGWAGCSSDAIPPPPRRCCAAR